MFQQPFFKRSYYLISVTSFNIGNRTAKPQGSEMNFFVQMPDVGINFFNDEIGVVL
jgi:hypothetical protein